MPLVVILDDINDTASISELVNGALTCKYHKWQVQPQTARNNIRNVLNVCSKCFIALFMQSLHYWNKQPTCKDDGKPWPASQFQVCVVYTHELCVRFTNFKTLA